MQLDVEKKRFMASFYEEFAVYHKPWLRRLVERYKDRGLYPKIASDITHYYYDDADKEVALFASLILKNNNHLQQQITDLVRIMGEHPRQFVENREFVYMSYGKSMSIYLNGCMYITYWRLARLFDITSEIIKKKDYDIKDMQALLDEDLGIREPNLQMLMFVLCMDDGIGIGIRSDKNVLCPETVGVKKTLNSFLPDYIKTYTTQEAIELQGLEKSTDFLYASFAWEELCKKHPVECSRHTTLLHKKFENRSLYDEKLWNKYTEKLYL